MNELDRLFFDVREAWRQLINEAFVSTRAPYQSECDRLRWDYDRARRIYDEAFLNFILANQ